MVPFIWSSKSSKTWSQSKAYHGGITDREGVSENFLYADDVLDVDQVQVYRYINILKLIELNTQDVCTLLHVTLQLKIFLWEFTVKKEKTS